VILGFMNLVKVAYLRIFKSETPKIKILTFVFESVNPKKKCWREYKMILVSSITQQWNLPLK
jgi:hypothetical protein